MAKKETFPGLIVIHGEDDDRRLREAQEALDSALAPEDRAMDYESLSAKELEPGSLATRIATPPFFAPRRVIRVDDAESMRKEQIEELVGAIERAMGYSSDSVTVILVFSSKSAPATAKGLLALAGTVVKADKMKWRDAESFVQSYTRQKRGAAFPGGLIRPLLNSLGYQTSGPIARALDRLFLRWDEAGRLSAEDIAAVTGAPPEGTVFDLCDAIGEKNAARAHRIHEGLQRDPAHSGPGAVVLIGRHLIQKIGRAVTALAAGEPAAAVSRTLGPDWMARPVMEQARGWSVQDVDAALWHLGEADLAMKTGADQAQALSAFIDAVASGRPRP